MNRPLFTVATLVVCLLGTAWPALGELTVDLELSNEYDDNVSLGSGNTPEDFIEEDYVWRFVPKLNLTQPWKDHSFTVNFYGEFREGIDTELSEYNLALTGLADFSFPSGLDMRVFNNYTETSFDQAVFFLPEDIALLEPGVSDTKINITGVGASYRPKERLSFDVLYQYNYQKFRFEDAAVLDDTRNIHSVQATVNVPVARTWLAYTSLDLRDQNADRTQFTFNNNRWVGGLRWEGDARFTLFMEAGYQAIDYQDTPGTEYEDPVFRVGAESQITEDTFFRAAVGRDGFGKFTYQVVLDHQRPGDSSFTIVSSKTTENSFSPATIGRIFEGTLFGGSWRKEFAERWTAKVQASYFLLHAEEAAIEQRDKTGVVRLRLGYNVRTWFGFGADYRYAKRTSTIELNEFTDNRLGVFLVFGLDTAS